MFRTPILASWAVRCCRVPGSNRESKIMKRIVFFAAIIGWVGLLPLQALRDAGSSSATKEEKVQIARAAAPSFISDNATIVDVDGSVLIEGDNGWTCSPGTQSDFLDPTAWMKSG